jgi:hypothetical protein
MNADLAQEQQRAVASAMAALSQAFGTDVALNNVTALSNEKRRNLVLRAAISGAGLVPRTGIIKMTRARDYNPASDNGFEESGLIKEWVATSFLTGQAGSNGHSPNFIAGDATAGLIVLEDLGRDLPSLVSRLLDGPSAVAEQALASYARCVARLHAGTLGCTEGHTAALRRAFPASRPVPPFGGERWRREVATKVHGLLGGNLPDHDIATVARHMAQPGPWLGLAHRDACPDNVFLIGTEARLVDFEFAGPGHVLLDASYWRMGFPTCWCAGRIPSHIVRSMDSAYRECLSPSLPQVIDDDAFSAEMAILLFARLFASLSWLLEDALKEDRSWGISTIRARLLWYLEAAIAGAEAGGVLNDLAQTVAQWRADLAGRWPEVKPLALYPAFAV